MLTLSNILKINAISSGATGLLLVVFSKFSAGLFGIGTQAPFILVGLFLIGFSIFVMYNAFQKPFKPRQIVSIIWLDRLWVLVSLLVIAIYNTSISTIGLLLILAVAVWVGLMAYLQNAKLIRV
jgi:hypothetical protein